MRSMNEEDAVYATLLIQLLSDSDASVLDDRVHSWVEHQYDFVFSENKVDDDNHNLHAFDSRVPSPSPSSSVGAHRSFNFDHPDVSACLPSWCTDPDPTSPRDTNWFSPTSPPYTLAEEEEHEEVDRTHSLGSIGTAHWKVQSTPPSSHNRPDKDLPAPPPSPASSPKRPASSRTLRSRSSSGRMSRLTSLTSTLSSDQSQTQDIHPPLPVPAPHSLANIGSRKRSGSFPRKFLRVQDDKDSPYPSPTLSDFSLAYSGGTALTTPCVSTPASPTSPTFISAPCSPENIALSASPLYQQGFFREQAPRGGRERSRSSPASPVLPKASIPVSPSTVSLVSAAINVLPTSRPPPATSANSEHEIIQHHRTAYSQSQWSVTTESSLKPLPSEPWLAAFSTPRTTVTGDRDKEPKTPMGRTRLLSLITRLSPGRSNASSTLTAGSKTDQHSAAEAGKEQYEEMLAPKWPFGGGSSKKKVSLASIRTSFSLSRTSFSSHRPSTSSKDGQLSSLPTSPIQTFHNISRPSLTDGCVTPLSKKSTLASLRASFSLSRTSFSSLVSPTEEVPPLPPSPGHIKTSSSTSRPSLTDGTARTLHKKSSLASPGASVTLARASPLPASPTRTSFSMSRTSFTDGSTTSEAVPPVPKVSLPKAPPRAAQIDTTLISLPHSLSKMNSPSQVSFSETVATSASASASCASLLSSTTSHSAPGTSSIPLPSKRMSMASAAGVGRSVSTSSMPACDSQIPTKPILRLTAKPSGPRMPTLSSPRVGRKVTPPRTPVLGKTELPSFVSTASKALQSSTKFTPPAKIASVLEARSGRLALPVSSSISVSAQPTRTSQLPTPFDPTSRNGRERIARNSRKLSIPLNKDPLLNTVRASNREGDRLMTAE